MRSSGVPNFPDPTPSGNFNLHPGPGGVDPLSPAFSAALPKCQKLHPLPGGLPSPGQATHPSKQALAQALRVSQCMRSHGVSWFPDPRTSVPSDAVPARYRLIVDESGAILAIPYVPPQAGPAYWQAAAACGIGSGNTVSETRCASRSVWSGRFRWSGRKDTSVARALKSETVAKPLGAYNPMHRGAQKESKWATASIPSA
jgi:hypothetical protein